MDIRCTKITLNLSSLKQYYCCAIPGHAWTVLAFTEFVRDGPFRAESHPMVAKMASTAEIVNRRLVWVNRSCIRGERDCIIQYSIRGLIQCCISSEVSAVNIPRRGSLLRRQDQQDVVLGSRAQTFR